LIGRSDSVSLGQPQAVPYSFSCRTVLLMSEVKKLITAAKFYGNQLNGFGVTGPPKCHHARNKLTTLNI